METLRRILERVQQQLSLMTRSQQVAIGLCAVIIMGSLMWLAQWSTEPHLVPLLDQPMKPQELASAVDALQGLRAEFDERGDRIYVKPDERRSLVRQLSQQSALPQDTSLGFENLLKEQSPFQPASVNQRNYNIARCTELAAVIATDPNISKASVFITDTAQRKIGNLRNIAPSASIDVWTVGGKQLDHASIEHMANLVSHTVAALEPHNVSVSVNGRPRTLPGPDEMISAGLLDETKKNEKHLEEKIHDLLDYIPGVKVAVSAELETIRRHVQKTEHTEAVPRMSQTSTETSNAGTPANEPGVNPNTGTALNNAATGQSSSKEDETTEYFPPGTAAIVTEEHAPFTRKSVTASVNIPRSYFVTWYKADNADSADPTDADLKPLIDIEIPRVEKSVMTVLGVTESDAVQVDWFPDLAPPGSPAGWADGTMYAGVPGGEEQSTAGKISSYAPQFGMFALAATSLIMMVMLVRKSSRSVGPLPPPPSPDQEEEDEFTSPLESAQMTDGFLMGQEVDEETLRANQLGEQVSQLVDDNPEAAADMLRRWVEQD